MPKETVFLVCQDCGESFDSIEPASTHDCELNEELIPTYLLMPESEAF
jgi:hypothetical protein